MPAKPSGEIKTGIIRKKQNNGDIYIYERQTVYDPEKKYNRSLNSKLIAKIPKGSEEMVPTHHRQAETGRKDIKKKTSPADRHIGMMDLIDFFGATSGIDSDLYAVTDADTAKKALSLARYLLVTDGGDILGIQEWQHRHALPWEYGMTVDVCRKVLSVMGDEGLQRKFFSERCKHFDAGNALSYGSIAVPRNAMHWNGAYYCCNGKESNGRLMVFYSADTGQPVAFRDQDAGYRRYGNETNNDRVQREEEMTAIHRMSEFLGLEKPELIIGDRCCSEFELTEFMHKGIRFIVPVDSRIGWVKSEIDAHRDILVSKKYACHPDPSVHGISVMKMHEFESYKRHFIRRIYLNLYFSTMLQEDDGKYGWGKEHCGYFVLASKKKNDLSECLGKYKTSERIKHFFQAGRQHVDAPGSTGWGNNTANGVRFIQFLTLCYYEHIRTEIQKFRDSLGRPNGDPAHDTKENLDAETRLREWLDITPIHRQLQWFDGPEPMCKDSSVLARDKLYLEKIGMDVDKK